MAALDTVQKVLTESRRLLQDEQVGSYRYPDVDIVDALNLAMTEVRRLRPDLLLPEFTLPDYTTGALSAAITIDSGYRMALVYYIIGHIQLRDDEPTVDQRAAAFKQKFMSQMLTIAS